MLLGSARFYGFEADVEWGEEGNSNRSTLKAPRLIFSSDPLFRASGQEINSATRRH